MNKSLITLTSILVATACQALAQYTDETTPLIVVSSMTRTDSYVNRTTVETVPVTIKLNPSSTYYARNINVTNNYQGGAWDPGAGIQATNTAALLDLRADEGTWNVITTNGAYARGLWISTKQESFISNTKFITNGHSSTGMTATGGAVSLDNVRFHLSSSLGENMMGLHTTSSSTVSNQGQRGITITSDRSGPVSAAIWADDGGSVDLHDATIDIYQTRPDSGGVLHSCLGAVITLTDSRIASSDGNTLIDTHNVGTGTVNLHNVNLDRAKNQRIYSSDSGAVLQVNLSGETHLDGYTQIGDAAATIHINLESGASWNVTEHSDLGLNSTLILDGTCAISFVTDLSDFTNINAAVVMLEAGAVLQLDRNADAFETGDLVTLFTGAMGDDFTNEGALLLTADGYRIDYIDYDNGTFEVRGVLQPIPEPSGATLGLLSLVFLAVRRKR